MWGSKHKIETHMTGNVQDFLICTNIYPFWFSEGKIKV